MTLYMHTCVPLLHRVLTSLAGLLDSLVSTCQALLGQHMVATSLLFAAAQVLYTDPSFHRTNTSCEISRRSSHGEHSAPQ